MSDAVAPRQIGRRELLTGAGVAALATVMVGPGRGLLPFGGSSTSPFDRSQVVARVGETFRVATGEAKGVVLRVAEVTDLVATKAVDVEQQFSVRFVGPVERLLEQGTYEFATRSFGRLPLFVTPMSEPGAAKAAYEAVVNRVVPSGATRAGGGS